MSKAKRQKPPSGFTIIELLIVMAIFGIMALMMSLPLSSLQADTSINDAVTIVKDSLRRAQLQAMAGHFGDSWGIHFSDSDACALPALDIHVFRSGVFTSATDTLETIALPDGSSVTAVSVGGGCDVNFSRFHGTTSSVGTITVSNVNGLSRTVEINQYGRIISP